MESQEPFLSWTPRTGCSGCAGRERARTAELGRSVIFEAPGKKGIQTRRARAERSCSLFGGLWRTSGDAVRVVLSCQWLAGVCMSPPGCQAEVLIWAPVRLGIRPVACARSGWLLRELGRNGWIQIYCGRASCMSARRRGGPRRASRAGWIDEENNSLSLQG